MRAIKDSNGRAAQFNNVTGTPYGSFIPRRRPTSPE